jgi:CDGSH-type Zn-finger protein
MFPGTDAATSNLNRISGYLLFARLPQSFNALSSCMRRVIKSDKQPFEVKPQEKSVWICMCGLSKNQPFCDGSHKTVTDEEDGKTYEYDTEGHRHEI